jgi:hypothetical protein
LARKTTSQSIPNNTLSKLTFDAEHYDDCSWHDPGNNSRLTGPPGVSVVKVFAGIQWGPSSGGDQHQRPVRHLPLGLGLLDVAGLQRRHRAHRLLRLVLDPCDGAAVARRSVRLSAPMERAAALFGSAPPATPPSTGSGVVVCLMG